MKSVYNGRGIFDSLEGVLGLFLHEGNPTYPPLRGDFAVPRFAMKLQIKGGI